MEQRPVRVGLRRQPASPVSAGHFRLWRKHPTHLLVEHALIGLRCRKVGRFGRQSADFRGRTPVANFRFPNCQAEDSVRMHGDASTVCGTSRPSALVKRRYMLAVMRGHPTYNLTNRRLPNHVGSAGRGTNGR